jgi:alcohol dehydrogenase YqhD (iron-dependent ADH family)
MHQQKISMKQPVWNFEQEPDDEPVDETAVNLRAYFDRMPDKKIRQYSRDWTDKETIEWDNNFRDDGNLMLLCSERDVDVREYRRVLEKCIDYRNRIRPLLKQLQ